MMLSKISNHNQKASHQSLPVVIEFDAIGTSWQIVLPQLTGESKKIAITKLIKNRIYEFDIAYSRFNDSSLVTDIDRHPGSYTLPPDAKPLFDIYNSLYELTSGLMTPLMGHVLEDVGYDRDYSFTAKTLRDVPDWKKEVLYQYPYLTTHSSVLIDLGAAGKGYLIDIIGNILEVNGINSYSINGGGDILQRNTVNTLKDIGLENPHDITEIIGIAHIKNGSICGSADNRRRWGKYTHIINPEMFTPVQGISAIWVYASTALVADALSTALYFTDADTLRAVYNFEYAILRESGELEYSDKFPATFFTSDEGQTKS